METMWSCTLSVYPLQPDTALRAAQVNASALCGANGSVQQMMSGLSAFRLVWGPVEVAVLRRAMALWLLIRVAVSGLLVANEANPLSVHPRAALIIVATVGFLSWIDTKRRNEDLLLANLGTSRYAVHGLGVGPALVFEILIGTLSRA
jgi:hypothetical protein